MSFIIVILLKIQKDNSLATLIFFHTFSFPTLSSLEKYWNQILFNAVTERCAKSCNKSQKEIAWKMYWAIRWTPTALNAHSWFRWQWLKLLGSVVSIWWKTKKKKRGVRKMWIDLKCYFYFNIQQKYHNHVFSPISCSPNNINQLINFQSQ